MHDDSSANHRNWREVLNTRNVPALKKTVKGLAGAHANVCMNGAQALPFSAILVYNSLKSPTTLPQNCINTYVRAGVSSVDITLR
jgi:hypothetical protein